MKLILANVNSEIETIAVEATLRAEAWVDAQQNERRCESFSLLLHSLMLKSQLIVLCSVT
eukprot:2164-Heterococcus_DN1.PRE.2